MDFSKIDLTNLPKGTRYIGYWSRLNRSDVLHIIIEQEPQKRTICVLEDEDDDVSDHKKYFLSFPYTVYVANLVVCDDFYSFSHIKVGFREVPLQRPTDIINSLPLSNYADRDLSVCLGDIVINNNRDPFQIVKDAIAAYWSSSFTDATFEKKNKHWIKYDKIPPYSGYEVRCIPEDTITLFWK